jgi:threonine dehydrogenase-like Zn-dependent dehydrogenase
MGDGRIKTRPLITHTFPLEKINEAFQTFIQRTGGAIKVVVKL